MTKREGGPWRPVDTFAARLVLVRRELGLSQRAAAEQTGIGFGSWQSMEDGRSPHNLLEKVQRIVDEFGVDREWLLWGGALDPAPPSQEGHSRSRSKAGSPTIRQYPDRPQRLAAWTLVAA